MSTLAPARRTVKPAVVVLFDSECSRSDRTAGFAAGLDHAPAHAPAAVPSAPAHKWATDEEYRRHFLDSTLSPAEWNARLEEMARDAYELDAVCRGVRGF